MPDPSLLDCLCDDLFPALRGADPAAPRDAVVRRLVLATAAAVARQRGLDLPAPAADDPLGGLPIGAADVTLPGALYSRLLADRHEKGSYYTPPPLARQVAGWTLEPLLDGAASVPAVLDPALGSGHFLVAAGEVIADGLGLTRWQAAQRLYGLDSDPFAVELARLTLWLWAAEPGTSPGDFAGRLLCADALLGDWPAVLPPQFDAVLGNPPYASVFTRARGGDEGRAEALKARYRAASGSFDLAAPFVERAVELCSDGGRVGLVLPNKLLAASYAEGLRRWLAERVTVEALADYAGAPLFDAGVYPVVLVMQKRAPEPHAPLTVFRSAGRPGAPVLLRRGTQADLHAPGAVWSAALDPVWDELRACLEGGVPLGEVVEMSAGLTVGEAYDLRDRVIDAAPGMLPAGVLPLITSGLIHRHHSLWGQKGIHYLKRRYRRPVIAAAALPARRREQARSPKLIVAGLALRPRAVLDGGLAQAAVSTTILYHAAWPLGALGALLNSALVARLYRALFGGLALAGGYLRFGQRELALLPLPRLAAGDPRLARLDALGRDIARADAVARGDLDAQIDRLVCELYGVGEDVGRRRRA